MDEKGFRGWLQQEGYNDGTINSRVSNCIRVCDAEGDLDEHYFVDKCNSLLEKLTYTVANQRNSDKPKHCIPINGNIFNGTATLKQAVNLYVKFLMDTKFNPTEIIANKKPIKKDVAKKIVTTSPKTLDSYAQFLEYFDIDKKLFYDFGIDNTIYASSEYAYEQWKKLKKQPLENKPLTIRGYGRQGKHTELYFKLYSYLFDNSNINEDKTNNAVPRKNIQAATGHRTNITLFNYQCSHIFGHTKNPLLFEAVWNICFTPKLFDPLTGHEAKGPWPEEYQRIFIDKSMHRFEKCILDYNEFVKTQNILERIPRFVETLVGEYDSILLEKFQEDALSEWQEIRI